MRPRSAALAVLSILVLTASACGATFNTSLNPFATPTAHASGNSNRPPAPAPKGTAATGATRVIVMVTSNPKLGPIVTDGQGRTLYTYLKDAAGVSTCYGACGQLWSPLLVVSPPKAGTGVDPARLTEVLRSDGSLQVVYNGWPLYYFANDVHPGDANGQGTNTLWYAVSSTGDPVK